MSARDRAGGAADLAETLVVEAPDLALCGSRVTEGRVAQSQPLERLPSPATASELRAARVSELMRLRRMAPQPEAFDRVLVAHGSIRVLLCAGTLVGAVGWLEPGAPSPDAPAATGATLRALFVDAAHQRQGHGRRLLEACCAELRGLGVGFLDADAPAEAVPFLVRHGFRAIGPVPRRASDHAPQGVLMTRYLVPPAAIV